MSSPVTVGRYLLHDEIASGGMARVHVGRMLGPAGFSRTVAIKRMHPHLTGDPKFATMFLDEARLASRVVHPNVVGTLDVVVQDGEMFLVMDFVRGESLAQLMTRAAEEHTLPSVAVCVAIVASVLHGLHAAHEATDEAQQPLAIVHRDVSPQNVLVGLDGVARVVDFGIAKAASRRQHTEEGELKGKLAYMAPEQTWHAPVDRRTDVYGAAVVLWELLTHRRLFAAESPAATLAAIVKGDVAPPSAFAPEVPGALDQAVLRGLAYDPAARFATALDMAEALARAVVPASPREVAAWVERAGGEALRRRVQHIADLEQGRIAPNEATIAGVLSGTERRRIVEAPTGAWSPSGAPSSARDVTVAAPEPAAPLPPARAPRLRYVLAAGLLVAAASGGFAAASLRAGARRAAPAAETATSMPSASVVASAAATAPTSVSAAVSAEASPAPATPAVVPPTSAASRPTRPVAGAPARRPTTPRAAPASAPAAPAASGSCDPPYSIDENGIKRFKRWCASN